MHAVEVTGSRPAGAGEIRGGRGRVLVDLVANHTSHQHPWFVESRSSRASPKRDWYLRDLLAVRTGDPEPGRDRVRTPMPWRPGPGVGFTTAGSAWLPDGGRGDADTVAPQRDDAGSTLHRYRALLSARRDNLPGTEVPVDWLDDAAGPMVSYRRADLLVAANCGDAPATVRPPGPLLPRVLHRCGRSGSGAGGPGPRARPRRHASTQPVMSG